MSGKQQSPGTFRSGVILGAMVPVTAVMVICAASLWLSPPPDSEPPSDPQLQTLTPNDGRFAGASIVHYRGLISPKGKDLLIEQLEHLPKDRRRWISMESPGGDVPAAAALVQYANTKGIGVTVAENRQCASACVTLFAQATTHYADDDAYFGFHYRMASGLLFNSSLFDLRYEYDIPVTADMAPLTRNIENPRTDLADFFDSCRNGNPTHSRKVIYLSWRQITAIVQGNAAPKCDDIVGQDSTWLAHQIASLH